MRNVGLKNGNNNLKEYKMNIEHFMKNIIYNGLDRRYSVKKLIKQFIKRPNWYNLRSIEPISRVFGFGRGTPIDRIYIEHFLNNNRHLIRGVICEICTQTLSFIYDFKSDIKGIYYVLKPNRILLATIAGISQISRYDMKRWSDYWRFTPLSIEKAFIEIFGKDNVEVNSYGNVLSSIAFLEGISAEELSKEEIFYKDADYPIIITVKAKKSW